MNWQPVCTQTKTIINMCSSECFPCSSTSVTGCGTRFAPSAAVVVDCPPVSGSSSFSTSSSTHRKLRICLLRLLHNTKCLCCLAALSPSFFLLKCFPDACLRPENPAPSSQCQRTCAHCFATLLEPLAQFFCKSTMVCCKEMSLLRTFFRSVLPVHVASLVDFQLLNPSAASVPPSARALVLGLPITRFVAAALPPLPH